MNGVQNSTMEVAHQVKKGPYMVFTVISPPLTNEANPRRENPQNLIKGPRDPIPDLLSGE